MSLVNEEFAKRVLKKDEIRKGNFGSVTAAGGGQLAVAGRALLPFRLGSTQFIQSLALIPGLVYSVVLGRDFCCKHGSVLDDEAGVFKIHGQ